MRRRYQVLYAPCLPPYYHYCMYSKRGLVGPRHSTVHTVLHTSRSTHLTLTACPTCTSYCHAEPCHPCSRHLRTSQQTQSLTTQRIGTFVRLPAPESALVQRHQPTVYNPAPRPLLPSADLTTCRSIIPYHISRLDQHGLAEPLTMFDFLFSKNFKPDTDIPNLAGKVILITGGM